ncbi:Probable outer membrane efflux protein precursor [Flavobacterium indicum GPTSA100-9 = DSM 17447]|uniref:Probable outer membrane efflux protein n=1 Tax=Flavobacterium indicum (strain DSM 17447 / CIP 109464 / GPTSA100-9) TaxID=1094466 RepID=H8XQ68_FLAIG|nr:TolC family protein [Flavobacterium indicum]CCG52362.1 Probable outer membrane efflux protein precursor [Flavobacterium indicum GPTSA100-9 = DSM 17447]
MKSYRIVIVTFLVGFSSLAQSKKWTLRECINHAIINNISVKQSELDLQNSQIAKKDAIGNFMPGISASASHSWNIGLNQNITTGLLQNQTTQFTSVGLSANVDIFRGLQNVNQLRKSNLSLIASQYQLTKMQEDIALNVANAYLQILFNKENLKVQKEQKSLSEKQLARTTQLVEAGNVPKGDLLDVQATLASNNQKVIAAENAVLLSKLSLAQLLQLDDFKNFDISEDEVPSMLSTILNESSEAIIAKAKASRTELKIAQTNIELAKKDIQIARAAYLPSLTGFYSYTTRASNSKRVSGVDSSGNIITANALPIFDQFDTNKGQNFGLQLTVPIFNGFATRNNVERTKVAFERSKLNFNQQELDLERNVFTAYTDTKAAKESFEAATASLASRKLAFEYAKERYEIGLMNVFDFNQSQTALANAESEVVRTKYDYIFRIKILEFYFGVPLIEKQ